MMTVRSVAFLFLAKITQFLPLCGLVLGILCVTLVDPRHIGLCFVTGDFHFWSFRRPCRANLVCSLFLFLSLSLSSRQVALTSPQLHLLIPLIIAQLRVMHDANSHAERYLHRKWLRRSSERLVHRFVERVCVRARKSDFVSAGGSLG